MTRKSSIRPGKWRIRVGNSGDDLGQPSSLRFETLLGEIGLGCVGFGAWGGAVVALLCSCMQAEGELRRPAALGARGRAAKAG